MNRTERAALARRLRYDLALDPEVRVSVYDLQYLQPLVELLEAGVAREVLQAAVESCPVDALVTKAHEAALVDHLAAELAPLGNPLVAGREVIGYLSDPPLLFKPPEDPS